MSMRTRIRRWWIGRDLYERASVIADLADMAEVDGRERAHAFIREVHAEHPNPTRNCIVPNCCKDNRGATA